MKKKKSYHHGNLEKAIIEECNRIIIKKKDIDFSMREVANALGVTHVAVYKHFKNREALLARLAEEAFLHFSDSLEKCKENAMSPREYLKRQAFAYIDFALKYPHYYHLMFFHEIKIRHLYKNLQVQSMRAFRIFYSTVDEAKANFRRGDPQTISLMLWSLLHGLVELQLAGRLEDTYSFSARDIKYKMEEICKLFLPI